MELVYPTHYFIGSGIGVSNHRLVSFDNALLSAGISNYNLLKVSSILPIACVKSDSIDLRQGSPLLVAYSTISSNVPDEKIATAVAAGIPACSESIGIIMETTGSIALEAEERVRAMVAEAMFNHGIPLDHIESSSIEGTVKNGYLSLISAIALW